MVDSIADIGEEHHTEAKAAIPIRPGNHMIELLKIRAIVRTARVLVAIGTVADFVRAVACRKAGGLVIEAAARIDAREAARR
jgi:hypothetical protein